MSLQYSDVLEIVNGPEDGAEFAITRPTFNIGVDASCVAAIRMDRRIGRFNARATAVSDGYRIRRIEGAAVSVNGKRAGKIFSRVMRSGDILRVGQTELILHCNPGGLASRSRGLPMESDFVWGLRLCAGHLLGLLGALGGLTALLQSRLLWAIAGMAALMYAWSSLRPSWAEPAWNALGWLFLFLRSAISA